MVVCIQIKDHYYKDISVENCSIEKVSYNQYIQAENCSIERDFNDIGVSNFVTLTFTSTQKVLGMDLISQWKKCTVYDNDNETKYELIPFEDEDCLFNKSQGNQIFQEYSDSITSRIDSSNEYTYKVTAKGFKMRKIFTEEKEEKGEDKMYYYFFIRFINNSGDFSDTTKIYTYQVSKEYYNDFHVGDIAYIKELGINPLVMPAYHPTYDTTEVRIEGKEAFSDSFLIEQRLGYSDIKTITRLDFIKHSTEPADWFEDFIRKQKYHIVYEKNDLSGRFMCYYQQSQGFWLYSYNDIIQKFYNPKSKVDLEAVLSEADLKAVLSEAEPLVPWDYTKLKPDPWIDSLAISEADVRNLTQSEINQWCDLHLKNTNKKKSEEKEMKMFDNITKNMKFGKYETADAKYSINGIAFRDEKGGYFVYTNNVATDVTGMTIDMPLFCMPVATNQIATNDIILFKDKIVVVKEKTDDGVKVIYPLTSEVKVIIPEKNLFNFDYCTKIINPFEFVKNTANENNPFGNLLPFILFDDMKNDKDNDMIKFIMFSQLGNSTNFNNMLPFLFLNSSESNKNMDSLLTLMMLSNFTNVNGKASTNSFVNSFFPNMNDSISKTQ